MVSLTREKMVAWVTCFDCELNGPGRRPFFRAKLDQGQSAELLGHLQDCAATNGRQWFLLVVTHDNTSGFTLWRQEPPAYEADASTYYVRGEVLKVTGKEGSCNIVFSARDGAPLLVERLQAVRQQMRRFLEIRVPNRHGKRNLIELIPDTELEAMESAEHQKLALAGEALAAEVLPRDDFGDWEDQND